MRPPPLMDIDSVVATLGYPASNERVRAMLNSFGLVKYRPKLDPDDSEAIADWFPIRESGVELGFKDEAYLTGQPVLCRGKGELIFHALILYGEHAQMDPYRGRLPFGLDFAGGRAGVQGVMSRFNCPLRSYKRDVWELPEHRVIASYSEGDTRLTDLTVMLRDAPWPEPDEAPAPLPPLATIIRLLGQSVRCREFVETFRPFGVIFELDEIGQGDAISVREEFGFDLGLESVPTSGRDAQVLKSITLRRERDLDARGWQGELPFGITFDDSPPQVFSRIHQPPREVFEKELTGSAYWDFPEFSLHVMYSLLENLIYRVTIDRPVSIN